MENSQEYFLTSPRHEFMLWIFSLLSPQKSLPTCPAISPEPFRNILPSQALACQIAMKLASCSEDDKNSLTGRHRHLAFTQLLFSLLTKPTKEKQPTNTMQTPPCFQPAWGCQEQQLQAATPGQSLRAQISPHKV